MLSYILLVLLLLAPDPAIYGLIVNNKDDNSIQVKRLIGLIIGAVIQVVSFALVMLILESYYPGFAIFGSFLVLMYLFNGCWRVLSRSKGVAHMIPNSVGGAIIWRLQHLGFAAAYWVIQPFSFDGRVNPYDIVQSGQFALILAALTWAGAVFFPPKIENTELLDRTVRISHYISIVLLFILLIRIWI